MTNIEATNVLDLLVEFPHAAGAFGAMRRYVKSVYQFSDFPGAQAVTRLTAELRRTVDPVREGELQYEIEEAERDAKVTVPRIVWGSILVAVYATFETGVRSALSHWCDKVPGASAFKVPGGGQFLKTAEMYSVNELGVRLFPSTSLKEAVLELKTLRDSFAHSTGRLGSRKTALHSTIAKARKRGYEIAIYEEYWIATPRLVAYYLLQTERAYKMFSDAAMEAYVSRMLPPAEA